MQRADIATPARGAYASLDELISLRFPARQLKLARRKPRAFSSYRSQQVKLSRPWHRL